MNEFELIHHLKKKHGLNRVGDDCAVLPKDDETELVITADMLVEEIDFRLHWTTAGHLGHKTLAVSLSDIAAMGATPKWAMLSIAIPQNLWEKSFLDIFYDGWHKLGSEYGVELVGGDISRSPVKLVIDSIVAGEVPKAGAVLRSTARPGDAIFVTGPLGGAAAGLRSLQAGTRQPSTNPLQEQLLRRQLRPSPRVHAGELARTLGASAMIDISDGLSSDLAHICTASGVGAAIDADLLPIDPAIAALGLTADQSLELALHGGEDFELLITVPAKKISGFTKPTFIRIGELTANADLIELRAHGKNLQLTAKGYRHF